jgi:hypothetical protein
MKKRERKNIMSTGKKTTAETEKANREARNARKAKKQTKQDQNRLRELKSAVVKSPGRLK